MVSAHRSRGAPRGEVLDLLSRLAPGNEKAHGYKLWVAVGVPLLRFPIGPGLGPPDSLGIFPLGPPLILGVWGGRGPQVKGGAPAPPRRGLPLTWGGPP